jgi:hypothetical protein
VSFSTSEGVCQARKPQDDKKPAPGTDLDATGTDSSSSGAGWASLICH